MCVLGHAHAWRVNVSRFIVINAHQSLYSLHYRENSYILTIIDRFTRWPEVIPISSIDARTLCVAYISRFGVPALLISHKG